MEVGRCEVGVKNRGDRGLAEQGTDTCSFTYSFNKSFFKTPIMSQGTGALCTKMLRYHSQIPSSHAQGPYMRAACLLPDPDSRYERNGQTLD